MSFINRMKCVVKYVYTKLPAMSIAMFHAVCDTDGFGSFSNSIQSFRNILNAIEQNVISIEDYQVLPLKKRNGKYLLTFDDGLENFYNNAFPILVEKQLPFILFITTDNIGRVGYLSMKQIREIAEYPGCTIGSHCVHHKEMTDLSVEEIEKEFRESKQTIENWLPNKMCEYIAYPFGSNDSDVRKIARRYYKLGFAVRGIKATCITCLGNMQIPRIDMSDRR